MRVKRFLLRIKRTRLIRIALVAACCNLVLGLFLAMPATGQHAATLIPVLKASTTMSGQPITFVQTDRPEVTSSLLTLAPGGETGRHYHPTSSFNYVFEGTITIEFDTGERREFQAGEAYMETVDTIHNARNLGNVPMKLIVATFSEQGRPNVIRPATNNSELK
jgi:quercetin dioxygenase-like cupin family protein